MLFRIQNIVGEIETGECHRLPPSVIYDPRTGEHRRTQVYGWEHNTPLQDVPGFNCQPLTWGKISMWSETIKEENPWISLNGQVQILTNELRYLESIYEGIVLRRFGEVPQDVQLKVKNNLIVVRKTILKVEDLKIAVMDD